MSVKRFIKEQLSKMKGLTDWPRVRRMKDAQIDTGDDPETEPLDWSKARVRVPEHWPKKKKGEVS